MIKVLSLLIVAVIFESVSLCFIGKEVVNKPLGRSSSLFSVINIWSLCLNIVNGFPSFKSLPALSNSFEYDVVTGLTIDVSTGAGLSSNITFSSIFFSNSTLLIPRSISSIGQSN